MTDTRSTSGQSRIKVMHDKQRFVFDGSAQTYTHKVLDRTSRFLELDLLEDARRHLSVGDVVIDAGAHVGNHTIFFAGVVGCHVVAIEPDADNFKSLEATVAANSLEAKVDLHETAIGRSEGLGEIRDREARTASTLSVTPCPGGDIPIRTLDGLVSRDMQVKLLKIDIEGAERDALLGAKDLIERCRPRIYAECLEPEGLSGVHDVLQSMGYYLEACVCASPTFVFTHPDTARTPSDGMAFGLAALRLRQNTTADIRRQREIAQESKELKKTALKDLARLEAVMDDAENNSPELDNMIGDETLDKSAYVEQLRNLQTRLETAKARKTIYRTALAETKERLAEQTRRKEVYRTELDRLRHPDRYT